jgi:hypothetical protein
MNILKSQNEAQELGADGVPSGVEYEAFGGIEEPFDPASISIEPRVIAMDAVIRRLRQSTIRLAPTFQRKYVWDQVRQSQLIESLMLRIPLPMFYVAANQDGTWDVVDGLQRLTTIRNFILGGQKDVPDATPFTLTGLEFWGDRFDGKSFNEIEANVSNSRIVNNILETEMRFTVINPGTPEEVKRNIFKRINTGGMPLTQQEIRHALYQGVSTKLLEKLVQLQSFARAVDDSIDDSRMAGRELILRFLAFHVFDSTAFTGDMDKFLSNAMRTINCMPNISEEELAKIFRTSSPPSPRIAEFSKLEKSFEVAMDRSVRFFGEYAFRKSVTGQRRTPVNKALFEAWTSIFAEINEEEFQALQNKRDNILPEYKALLNSDDFDRAISRDSSSIFGVRERYKSLRILINKNLESKND